MKIALFIVVGLVLFVVVAFAVQSYRAQSKTVAKGLTGDGLLHSCDDKPNCISTNETREEFKTQPIQLKEETTLKQIHDLLVKETNPEVIKLEDNYLHLTYRTTLFRFPDDLEFTIVDSMLHVRSQSRAGYSDMGKNRSRLSKIVSILKQTDF